MSCSLRCILILLAVFAASANVHAAGKPPHRPAAHPVPKPPHHTSHTKTIHYRRPAVHRPAVPHARRPVTRSVRRPVIRTVHRYPVHRVHRRYVRPSNYFVRNYRRAGYYNRGYGRSRRYFSRGVRGIVEGVQGNAGNGMVLVKVFRPRSSRFRYATALAGVNRVRGVSSAHRFHVNNATRYEILSVPRRAGTFASLHKGEEVLILKRSNQSNIAQRVEVFPRRAR